MANIFDSVGMSRRSPFQSECRICQMLGIFLLFLAPNSMAAPPLVTDDPGILDPGTWEIISATSGEQRPIGSLVQAPALDVSVGLTDHSQLSFFLPYLVASPAEGGKASGLGIASLAYKWRFISTSSWELAFAPNYSMPLSNKVLLPAGLDDVRLFGLPLIFAHNRGIWTWNGQIAWNVGSDGINFWEYGLALSRPLGSSLQWMMEFYGGSNASFEKRTLNYQLGLDYEIRPDFHALVSVGSSINSLPAPEYRLNYSYYFGLQWLLK